MGKRGPRSKVTVETIDRIKQLYSDGSTHNAISKELGISETNIRRILKLHGTPKRNRKLATLLTSAEEGTLVNFLCSLGYFPGKYRQLRELMGQFAAEHDMRCSFTYSWRDGFVRRHRSQLPHHIIKLLSPKIQRTDDLDADLDGYGSQIAHQVANSEQLHVLDDNGVPIYEVGLFPHADPTKEPSVWRQKPKVSTAERSVRESTKAFMKAGLTREEAQELLRKLKVPEPLLSSKQPDVVAAALNDALGEGSNGVEGSVNMSKPRGPKKAPLKKTPLQIELLEKAFAKSQTCGDKRAKKLARILGLSPAQIIYWFHNTARFKRKKLNTAVYESVTEEPETSETGGEMVETEGGPEEEQEANDELQTEGDEIANGETESHMVLQEVEHNE